MTTPAEVIDWIEAELAMDDGNFRDIDVIIADARARFVGSTSSGSGQSDTSTFPLSNGASA